MKVNQHTVSRFYLSQFTPPQGQQVLWVYEKGNALRPAQRSPKNCACEDYFYAIEGPNGVVAARGHGVTMKRNFHLIDLFRRAREFAEVIYEMNWTVNVCKSCEFFVTSDNPAFVRRPPHLRDPGLVGINRSDLGAELGFPLSRRSFLIAKSGRGGGLRIINVSKLRVRELNTRTVLSAHRLVFSAERNDMIGNLVKENEDFRLIYPSMPA